MIIRPKIRGFICTTAHPTGCAAHVREQIAYVKSRPAPARPRKRVLVVGASAGYGLASRIALAFGSGAATVGVFFEKPGTGNKTGSAGWYNSAAFEVEARAAGLYARSFNGDAFSHEMKAEVIAAIKDELVQVDHVVYSLASPRRTDPNSGEVYRSVLKPIGAPYEQKTLDTDRGLVTSVRIEPAEDEEIAQTIKVMGGEDWELWMDALATAGVLAEGASTVAYSYIGPDLTYPIYTAGTIGRAKEDLERAAAAINARPGVGTAVISVNKALVTQASSAIPVVPLYISLLYQVMKDKGLHEGCIEQITRLYRDHLGAEGGTALDGRGRVRIDDWEMRQDVQEEVAKRWEVIDTERLGELSDFAGYQAEFLKLFGFGLAGVDYEAEVEAEVAVPSLA
jgi:enoyl-[acyl-carrier protein] reductase / trans-2-enoyl-CoA reductase (NAD+)